MEEAGWDKCFSFVSYFYFFFSCVLRGGEGEGCSLLSNHISTRDACKDKLNTRIEIHREF